MIQFVGRGCNFVTIEQQNNKHIADLNWIQIVNETAKVIKVFFRNGNLRNNQDCRGYSLEPELLCDFLLTPTTGLRPVYKTRPLDLMSKQLLPKLVYTSPL